MLSNVWIAHLLLAAVFTRASAGDYECVASGTPAELLVVAKGNCHNVATTMAEFRNRKKSSGPLTALSLQTDWRSADVTRITSDGTDSRPYCSWQTTCTWDSATKEKCAEKLCQQAGYGVGAFVGASNDMCSSSFAAASHQSVYEVDTNTMSVGNANMFDAQITADCKAVGAGSTEPGLLEAERLCAGIDATTAAVTLDQTNDALKAWGVYITQERECCNSATWPHCLYPDTWWYNIVIVALLFIILVVVFVASWYRAAFPNLSPKPRVKEEPKGSVPDSELGDAPPIKTLRPEDRRAQLKRLWDSQPLHDLPDADKFEAPLISLFCALHQVFGYQWDSVANQFDHFLSTWLSHIAMVADRAVGAVCDKQEPAWQTKAIDESKLLHDGLEELHGDLLEGFDAWRESTSADDRCDFDLIRPGGAEWAIGTLTDHERRYLCEIAVYLLVWGECGNLRFMPELVYFFTYLTLVSTESPTNTTPDMYHVREGHFLAEIVRPVYNVVFEEWYDQVAVVKAGSNINDKKIFRASCANILPADVSNYDDWNELFCSRERLNEGLFMMDSKLLFELDDWQQYWALDKVDWVKSLSASRTKTHREMHSFWGVFAATHRIWLLHLVLFLATVCFVSDESDEGQQLFQHRLPTTFARFSSLCLLVPLHAFLWLFARWQVTGLAFRSTNSMKSLRKACWGQFFLFNCLYFTPLVTYMILLILQWAREEESAVFKVVVSVHYVISAIGCFSLFFPSYKDRIWPMTHVPLHQRLYRYFFWFLVLAIKVGFGYLTINALSEAILSLSVSVPGYETPKDLWFMYSPHVKHGESNKPVLLLTSAWAVAFLIYLTDTQLWFIFGCSFLGILVYLSQRKYKNPCEVFEDTAAKIPERFSKKILYYTTRHDAGGAEMSERFCVVWDRIVQWMRYENVIGHEGQKAMMYEDAKSQRMHAQWAELTGPVQISAGDVEMTPTQSLRKRAWIGRHLQDNCGLFCKGSPLPTNQNFRWRFATLGRNLSLSIKRPFQAPYIPGLTIMIPHFDEQILIEKGELYDMKDHDVPLVVFLTDYWHDEYKNFQQAVHTFPEGTILEKWEKFSKDDWNHLRMWASLRMQTLFRTVAGMTLYQYALQLHAQLQSRESLMSKSWRPRHSFTCLLTMQKYASANQARLDDVEQMLAILPDNLKIAFIDHQGKQSSGEAKVHEMQRRRYFSCLIDKNSERNHATGKRKPDYRIELPGYPILGDGKSDNQNHAIPFMRGAFSQCIDANQGGYFEQMLLLPCALAEFRAEAPNGRDRNRMHIIGLPEHITSDIGSVGDMAASAEVAFGTILQRSYAFLGARMHYGHPDLMNKQYMMQQGGVSKATVHLNLSEDIFAGMDFTLRGQGRRIKHCEYFHVSKGRDLGFGTVLKFFSKLASGSGEQILTRQMFRLGQVLHMPEALTFHYAHAGHYINQYFISCVMPILLTVWLMVLLSDCDDNFTALQACNNDHGPRTTNSDKIWSKVMASSFSWTLFLFLLVTSLPLIVETSLERGVLRAFARVAKQICSLSPLMFIFQAKVIGYYIVNDARFGGATYVNTGRGLPTHRRDFFGAPSEKGDSPLQIGGLYLDYAPIAYYDGMYILMICIFIHMAGDYEQVGTGSLRFVWLCVSLVLASYLIGPFMFNPYQFDWRYWRDWRSWPQFFFHKRGKLWIDWYEEQTLRPKAGRRFTLDIFLLVSLFGLLAWAELVWRKIGGIGSIWASTSGLHYAFVMAPPTILSLVVSILAAFTERLLSSCGKTCIGTTAIIVLLLDVVEAWCALCDLYDIGWYRALIATFIFKFFLLIVMLRGMESLLRRKWGFHGFRAFEIWLFAHKMLRDMIVSITILLALLPFALIDTVNRCSCPSLSVHDILIFHDPRQWKVRRAYHAEVKRATTSISLSSPAPSDTISQRPLDSAISAGLTAEDPPEDGEVKYSARGGIHVEPENPKQNGANGVQPETVGAKGGVEKPGLYEDSSSEVSI